jgi:hypothetical protein
MVTPLQHPRRGSPPSPDLERRRSVSHASPFSCIFFTQKNTFLSVLKFVDRSFMWTIVEHRISGIRSPFLFFWQDLGRESLCRFYASTSYTLCTNRSEQRNLRFSVVLGVGLLPVVWKIVYPRWSQRRLPLLLVWTCSCTRATVPVLRMWPCKLELDEEKSKHAGLAQQYGFGPAFLHSLLRLVKGTTKPNTCQRRV